MKKTATVIILTLAVIVAGVVIALKYNSGACDYEYTILSRNYQDCADSSNCTSIYLGYPVFGRKLFNDRAIDSINRHVTITEQSEEYVHEGIKPSAILSCAFISARSFAYWA